MVSDKFWMQNIEYRTLNDDLRFVLMEKVLLKPKGTAIGIVVEAWWVGLNLIIHEYFYYEFKLPAIKGNAKNSISKITVLLPKL